MPGDNVVKQPTLEEQVSKFKSFATQDGEVEGEAAENLNPVGTGVSASEAAAGAKVIEEKPVDLEAGEEGEKQTDTEKAKAAAAAKQPGAKKTVDARIAEVTKARRTAERQLAEERGARAAEKEAFEKRLAALEKSGLTPAKQGATSDDDDPNAPKATAYEYGELDPKFTRDLARYEARKEFGAQRATQEKESKSAAQTAEQKELLEKGKAFEDAGIAVYDDFEDLVIGGARAGEWDLTATIGQLILDEPETGIHVAYYLANNPKESKQVAKMTPAAQLKWYARKEIELSAESVAANGEQKQPAGSQAQKPQSKTPASKAPAPPQNRARGGNSTTQVSADTTDFKAFEAMATATRQ